MAAAPQLPIPKSPDHDDDDDNEDPSDELRQTVDRNHSWPTAVFMFTGLSMCITVDILQYSMPLAFLPSVLEDRGHEPMVIASAIGVYYWTGFAGGLCITSYQLFKLFTEDPTDKDDVVSVNAARKHVRYLMYGLALGTVTLIGQAMHPTVSMHTGCRFVQGFLGSFIFFYSFLLSVSLFDGSQQTAAMTAASTALNVAEVLGSTLGAWVFDAYGQRAVFWLLVVASVINQVFLVFVIFMVRGSGIYKIPSSSSMSSLTPEAATAGWNKIKKVLKSKRMGCSVILIMMAAVVKASVEEVLPFHADHRWGLRPLEIGNLFSVIATAYITSAVIAGKIWESMGKWRTLFGASWLAILGFATWGVFLTAMFWKQKPVLVMWLVFYGVALGMTHTPAALLLADAVEHERGRAKEAVNAIWNTMWEAGGSVGFLLGGLLAENYAGQLRLFGVYSICCLVSAVLMMAIAGLPFMGAKKSVGEDQEPLKGLAPQSGYGAAAKDVEN
mmetsp:Transcript_13214/g.38078  ORF Transcript_13214/g.38078 Transcript_13214/m.38078 type:complete len:499 (-) Transcript_13214:19-1515(-)